ncbi:MAG: 6-pyruvoyl tetrahydropterin synthase family protein [Pirellulaceae bacterium]|jgi:6-pyruvoyltetrahydropterin/6-carboxytetrahydropterin synthase|nr:6-pyruvoyl tetrahydropterin synthase family protein [Pirellulaceae bacterium]MDP7017910.1 6-pyruvoyl tetrahydropterin synthase family protein [Pirellulaceae bacterium]
MTESHRVELAKQDMVFSAAHFITFNGNVCERLHGHNYRVRCRVEDQLDENHYVIDFIALRDELRGIVDRLDHHVLLPTEHPRIRVTAGDSEVEAVFEDRRWVFPRGDCVLLPVANTTAELLAGEIGRELLDRLAERLGRRLSQLEIAVDENGGQWAVWEYRRQ